MIGRLRIYDVHPDGRAPAHYIEKDRVAKATMQDLSPFRKFWVIRYFLDKR